MGVSVSVVVVPEAGTGIVAMDCWEKRYGLAVGVPAVTEKLRLTVSFVGVVSFHEYGIFTVHVAVDPLRVAVTPAISVAVKKVVDSRTEAFPWQKIFAVVGIVDEIVMVNE